MSRTFSHSLVIYSDIDYPHNSQVLSVEPDDNHLVDICIGNDNISRHNVAILTIRTSMF